MTIDLANPAVAFLFFTGFGLWTIFVVWALDDELDRALPVILGVSVASLLVGITALFIVITNALFKP